MANRSASEWKRIYRQAIEYMGGKVGKRTSLQGMRDIWKSIRSEHRQQGIELPNVRTVSKTYEYEYQQTPRDENMNTLPPEEPLNMGYDYIESFKLQLETIYNDTKTWADGWSDKNLNSTDRRHRFIAHNNMDLLTSTYYAILERIDQLVLQFGYDAVAQALSSDVEMDYAIALSFMPPSSVENEMAMTLEQINGVMNRLTAEYESI